MPIQDRGQLIPPAPREVIIAATRPSILWFAQSYGYGRQMMYFGEIFRALRDIRPDMAVAAGKDADLANPYDIDLRHVVTAASIPNRRKVGDTQYDASIAIPGPTSALALRRIDPKAVILIEFGTLSLMATLATLGRRTARLLFVESDPELRGGRTSGPVMAIKRWIARRAHAVQTNNEAGRRFVIEKLRVPAEKVLMAPYLTSRPPGPDGDAPAPHAPVRILFANSVNERKNAAILVAALARCTLEVRAQVALTIVGDGPQRPALETAAQALGPECKVNFVGAVPYDELGRFYADADVLAIPSRADYRSLSGFEGLGYGLALLASTADGATKETVIEGETGFALDPDNTDAWAAAITRLVRDRALLRHCRASAMRLYRERFSLETIANNIAMGVDLALAQRGETRPPVD